MINSGILMVLVVTVALAVAGCSGSSANNATPTPTPASGGAATPTATATAGATPTAMPAVAGGTLGSLYDTSKASWFEFRTEMASQGMTITSDTKWENLGQEMHEGKMQNHMRITSTTNIPGVPSTPQVIDTWVDPNAPVTTGQNADYATSDAKLTQVGTETITVPAGTFACTKYTVTLSDGSTGTYWASSKVPVPVQYTVTTKDASMTYKLVGYGK